MSNHHEPCVLLSDALLPSLRVREQLDQVANLRGRSVPEEALERLQLQHAAVLQAVTQRLRRPPPTLEP